MTESLATPDWRSCGTPNWVDPENENEAREKVREFPLVVVIISSVVFKQ